jgi:hypothetical protein
MTDIKQGPPEGQEPVTSTSTPAPTPEVTPAWLSGLRTAIADVQAAVEDEQRPHRERRLGHLEAVRITREGFLTIEKALSCAERGLARLPPLT